jgi:hypothetical protein
MYLMGNINSGFPTEKKLPAEFATFVNHETGKKLAIF